MTAPSEIKKHVDQALCSDPRLALVGIRRLLQEDLPWMEERAVRLARSHEYSWGRIGRLLRRSRQAARKRFIDIDGTPQPLPRKPVTSDQITMRLVNGARADLRRRRELEELDRPMSSPGDAGRVAHPNAAANAVRARRSPR